MNGNVLATLQRHGIVFTNHVREIEGRHLLMFDPRFRCACSLSCPEQLGEVWESLEPEDLPMLLASMDEGKWFDSASEEHCAACLMAELFLSGPENISYI